MNGCKVYAQKLLKFVYFSFAHWYLFKYNNFRILVNGLGEDL